MDRNRIAPRPRPRAAQALALAAATAASAALLLTSVPASAAVKKEAVEYKVGEQTFKGHLAWDDAGGKGKRPGVLVVHEWWGLNDYAKMRAEKLAEMGYVALALDMYGDGKSTTHPQTAGEFATAVGKDPEAAKARFLAAKKLLESNPAVDATRIAAIGYCFGGKVVLEMARQGVDLKGVASFHGAIAPSGPPPKSIKAKVLACHGALDPMVTPDQIKAFEDEMKAAGADWQLVVYGTAKHSFTNPGADKAGVDGLAYDAQADARSWRELQGFLAEAFK